MCGVATGDWLTTDRVRAVAWTSGMIGVAMLAALLFGGRGTVDPFGQPIGSDFTAFYHGGRIANAGDAARAYDLVALNADLRSVHGVDYEMAWVYPPTLFFVASPLARLPYLPALLIWWALSLVAVTLVLKAIVPDRRALLVALASPLTPLVLAGGQNAFISAALLGAGLLFRGRRPWAAGTAFGALTYKPQLGVIIGPVLLIERKWTAIVAATLMTTLLVSLSALLWGLEAWVAFPTGLANGREWMEQGGAGFHKSASLFSLVRLWGGSISIAYVIQGAGLLFGLFLVWRATTSSGEIRNAAVCAAAALATPYLMDYDIATVGLGAVFLYAQSRNTGFLPYERTVLAFIWLAPWFTRATAEYLLLPLGPLATLLLALVVLRRALRASPSRR